MLSTISKKTSSFNTQIFVKLDKFRKLGFKWFFKEIISRALFELGWLVLLPLAVIAHLFGFRRISFVSQHIGHVATEPDTFLKALHLGLVPNRKHHYFLIAPANRVANMHLLSYWKKYFIVITQPSLCVFLEMLTRHYFVRSPDHIHRYSFSGTQPIFSVNQKWGQRPPLLSLSAGDERFAHSAFEKLGIPKDKWFVCLHVREAGFLPHNDPITDFRNASIENTFLAMQEIFRRGGIVVRMGDASMKPLPNMQGVIDYARHPLKSERLDVILCAKAKFFLGCTSGLAFLSMIFGVPVAYANMIPVETLGPRFCDLSMPKRVWSLSLNRYLRFDEIFNMKKGNFLFSHQYKQANWRVDENDSQDILHLVTEMLDRLEGNFKESEMDIHLHDQYLSLYQPGHYSYGAASRVSVYFLRRYFGNQIHE